MENKIDELKNWIKALGRFINPEEFAKIDKEEDKQGEKKLKISMFTNENVYHITGVDKDGKDGYLGATMSHRKPSAGETWTRGRDLADGKFNKETWEKIKDNIISCELVPLKISPAPDVTEEKVEGGAK